ncbi:MAG TPA: FAD-linked oxidase C-terminal domain-containing protein [Candidatus Acidoferrales bacterium]|nr:FAD-linked oxidase C-terminal domain-containing protein [Candidatus Acidoferrales bacterium]
MLIDLITGVERGRLDTMPAPPPGIRPDQRGAWNGDVEGLAAALRDAVAGEVRFDDGSRALYATDASNYRQVPIGVVIPRTTDDVVATVAVARSFGAPIMARGGGTSLAGQCCNVAVAIDFSKYLNRLLEVNVEERWARVEPGIVLDDLRAAVAEHGLWFGPDPATHTHNTLGGMIGNNSCGMHAQMAGKTSENTYELELLTYDGLRLRVGETSDEELEKLCAESGRRGELYRGMRELRDRYAERIRERFPDIPRLVSGYGLQHLLPENHFNVARALVGSEGTLALVLEAKVKLIPNPTKRVMLVLGFDDVYTAGDHVPEVNEHQPIALEGLDDILIGYMRIKQMKPQDVALLPEGKGWLMAEFGSDDIEKSKSQAEACMQALRGKAKAMKLVTDESQQKMLWQVRESGLGATAKIPGEPENWPGWEDSAVAPQDVGRYLRDLRALYDKYGYKAALYGHFGQGCIHCRVSFDLLSSEGVATWMRFLNEAAHLIAKYHGSLSGEHGDGQARAQLQPIMFGEEICQAFRAYKHLWDPQGRMNPGKLVDSEAYRPDENLRMGAYYRPWEPKTKFSYEPDDRGSFAYAANRCVGVGDCRRHDGHATMCPSYRVTHEEMHSTRGRARLLFEMLERAPLQDGWRSEAVKEALDLCLACKGCKGDCPVNVDMATYKAEFLSHYYERKPRPIWAYAFGLIPWWAHLASPFARIVNALTQTPGLDALAKVAVRMAPQRSIPPFAEQSFRAWWKGRTARPNLGGPRLILWADTFNTYFHATTAQHAVEVLEAAGYDVTIPEQLLCCGRPLYDYGMIDLGRILLREIINALRPEIEAGVPIVGLEPSCVSVFKDELLNLFPNDPDAKRLSNQTLLFSDFLSRADGWNAPQLHRRVVVHGHCHHKAVMGLDGTRDVLRKLGADVQELDDGCCGMAGAFGFEAGEHYDVSIACGELAFLPAVRGAGETDIIIGDGFSCREQMVQTTGRQGLHLADVVWMAQTFGESGPPGALPEMTAMPDIHAQRRKARMEGVFALGAVALLSVGALMRWAPWRRDR